VDRRYVDSRDTRRLMQGIPPIDRKLDDRQVDRPNQCKDCRRLSPRAASSNALARAINPR
jgi:hypothetical protein